jgi:hypothetical protein
MNEINIFFFAIQFVILKWIRDILKEMIKFCFEFRRTMKKGRHIRRDPHRKTKSLGAHQKLVDAPSDRKQLTVMFRKFDSTGLVACDNRSTNMFVATVQIACDKRFFASLERY